MIDEKFIDYFYNYLMSEMLFGVSHYDNDEINNLKLQGVSLIQIWVNNFDNSRFKN